MNQSLTVCMFLYSIAVFFSIVPSSDATFFQVSRISQVLASGNDVFVTWEESTDTSGTNFRVTTNHEFAHWVDFNDVNDSDTIAFKIYN